MRPNSLTARLAALLPIVALLAVFAAGCGGSSSADTGSGGSKINLVAYSTPQEAYDELIPAFQKTQAGKGTSFTQSYGPSGDQARAVLGGLPASFVHLSLESDVSKLAKAGLVSKDWKSGPHKGIVTRSVVVFVVRKGNPKHIKTWDDLVKPGVKVIVPNVFTSGGARWDVMAAYGQAIVRGQSPAQARAYLNKLYKNVPVQPKAAREALQTFTGGEGDVLISYENEAITAQQKGEDVDYVMPDQTILIENPAAVTTKSGPKAAAFLKFLYTPQAQKIYVAKGYRSVLPGLTPKSKFPDPKQLFTIKQFGGWKKVKKEFFDPGTGIVAGIEQKLGVSTSG